MSPACMEVPGPKYYTRDGFWDLALGVGSTLTDRGFRVSILAIDQEYGKH